MDTYAELSLGRLRAHPDVEIVTIVKPEPSDPDAFAAIVFMLDGEPYETDGSTLDIAAMRALVEVYGYDA